MVEVMEKTVAKKFFYSLPRRLFAIITALCIWLYVNYSITDTKLFPKIPVRIINLPADKTIRGIMPNGMLDHRLSITLTGTKDFLDRLDRKDFEIVLDATDKGDEWVVRLDKRNLVSKNPDFDFLHNITAVDHPEFIIKFSKLVVGKVPVWFHSPRGEPPEGYQFLDVFPQRVFHTVTGPEEDIQKLCDEGLEVTFDLSLISKEELDSLESSEQGVSDEVSFPVPDSWKRVPIPYLNGLKQDLASSEAKNLRIDFLRKDFLPLERDVPIWVFYPIASLDYHNPEICPLRPCKWITNRYEITTVHKPLFVYDVSKLFLDIVRDSIEIVIISGAGKNGQPLRWTVQLIDSKLLEDRYVQALLDTGKMNDSQSALPLAAAAGSSSQKMHLAIRDRFLRGRFREYAQNFKLYEQKGVPFVFHVIQRKDGVYVSE
jgi:hypothetical protein